MKRPETTHAERVAIIERHQAGATLAAIAADLQLSRFTVRHWWWAYRDGGWAALTPQAKGPPVVGPLGRFDPLVKYVALRLKREHLAWGPAVLRLHLSRRPRLQGVPRPQNTALWSYLHQFGSRLLAPRRPPTRRPAAVVPINAGRWIARVKCPSRVVSASLAPWRSTTKPVARPWPAVSTW